MFTGIIESTGYVEHIENEGSNSHFTIRSSISSALKIDQSIAHDGVCLTVTQVNGDTHRVTAIAETLNRSSLGKWTIGKQINLERCMKADGRFDGHIVQGHVDCIGKLERIEDRNGSWGLFFSHVPGDTFITVPKGSICVNGVSLTVVESDSTFFSVEIIPFTWQHTNLGGLKPGDVVNLEFDIIGKYLATLTFRKNN
ncbi:MAG: riboflavin synthase [Bacteroidia bacterium]|jgi:riboflavin synthase